MKNALRVNMSARTTVFENVRSRVPLLVAACMSITISACSFYTPPSSPDVIYSNSAEESRSLQVPPDLNNVSNGEQFILPGREPGSLSRNRLLPTFASARYVRSGEQNWLELEQPAETVWPLVLDFIRQQKLSVEKTEPTTGLIFTQWRSDAGKSEGGLLKNLISNEDLVSRYAFRLERNGGGTRLFTRSMQLAAEAAKQAPTSSWPSSSHNPEAVSQVLTRLLVFLGADEQKAKGILSEAQAKAVLDEAELERTASGTQLVVHSGFSPAFDQITTALQNLQYGIVQSDGSVGRIQVTTDDSEAPVLISLIPVHISAVRVQVSETGGAKLDEEKELSILSALHKQIV